MFLQQTFGSVGKVLPAVVAPLVIAEFDADPVLVGVYYDVAAAASLLAQTGCSSFIVPDRRRVDSKGSDLRRLFIACLAFNGVQ